MEKGTQQGQGNVAWTQYTHQQLSMDVLAEFPQTGPPRVNYLYRGRAGAIVTMEEQQGGGTGKEYWFAQDGLGSTAAVTKQDGQSAHDYFYHPEDSSNWTDPHNHYLLTGKEWDEESRLYYFGARYYDAAVGVWLTQDVYRGQVEQPLTLHRTLYVLANPVNHVDAYGYRIIEDEDESGNPILGPPPGSPRTADEPDDGGGPHIRFTADEGQSWHDDDKEAVLNAARAIAGAMRGALIRSNFWLRRTGDFDLMVDVPASDVLFSQVFGDVVFHQSASSCQDVHKVSCWAFTANPQITVYTNVSQGRYTFQNAAHELGHLFAQRAGRQPYRDLKAAQIADDLGNRVAGGGWPNLGYQRTDDGYALTDGRTGPWQQHREASPNEDFADMFLGWSHNHFANDPAGAGTARNRWMTANMPRWIALAVTGD